MPDLDIQDKSQDDAWAEVMEKIMFPDDEYLAECYRCIYVANKYLSDDNFWSDLRDPLTGEIRALCVRNIMNTLIRCPSIVDMRKKQEKAFAESFVVGLVLLNMYKMHSLKEDASLGKAAYATRVGIEKLQVGLPISDIEKKFRARRSSAHLVAALILYFNSRSKLDLAGLDELAIVLSTAKQFYDFGMTYKSPLQKQPIFFGDMWTIPNDYPLVAVDLPSKTTDATLISAMRLYQDDKKWEDNF